VALELIYAGQTFRVRGRTLEESRQDIAGILASGGPGWIEAVDGYGSRSPYHLLISPGVPLALCEVPED